MNTSCLLTCYFFRINIHLFNAKYNENEFTLGPDKCWKICTCQKKITYDFGALNLLV